MLRVGAASLDLRTRRARLGDRLIGLTAWEFAMAEMLFRHPGQVLSREQLLSHDVWGYDYDPGSNVVVVYIAYLRKKLGKGADRKRSRHRISPGGHGGRGAWSQT